MRRGFEMRREIIVDGKPFQVEVSNCNAQAPFSVKINDKPVEVLLENQRDLTKAFTIKVKGKPFRVELPKIDRQMPFSVKVNGTSFKVELKSAARQMAPSVAQPQASLQIQRSSKKVAGEGVVTAPMAGKIIKVKVKKGDTVKTGDVLCTLEAMKMENEVAAPKNGVIQEVMVQEGKTVNADDILVVIK
jgi:pyruvate carboxylase subunit B